MALGPVNTVGIIKFRWPRTHLDESGREDAVGKKADPRGNLSACTVVGGALDLILSSLDFLKSRSPRLLFLLSPPGSRGGRARRYWLGLSF